MTACAVLLSILLSALGRIRRAALQFPQGGRSVDAKLPGDLGSSMTPLMERFDLVP
nr:hypothetical protein [Deinococcus sp.]